MRDPSDAWARRAVLVLAKLPEPGRVKTRLAAEVGAEAACALYRAMASRVFDALRPLAADARLTVCYDPPGGEREARAFAGGGYAVRPQAQGSLGERLREAFRAAFEEGAERVAAVGADCVAMTGAHVLEAFLRLDAGADAVLGPAVDGGYYLIALPRERPALFEGIPWSTERVLAATLAAADRGGLRVSLLETLPDVDALEDVPFDLLEPVRRRYPWASR